MLTLEQYYLTKLAEEAVDVSQRALKAQQFGLDEIQQGQDLTNAQRLCGELEDLFVIMNILNDNFNLGYTVDKSRRTKKLLKLSKYARLSQELKRLEYTE